MGFCCCYFGTPLVYYQTDIDVSQVKKVMEGCAIFIGAYVFLNLILKATGTFTTAAYY